MSAKGDMMEERPGMSDEKKAFYHADGVTYFDKKTERAIFFVLTVIMLVCGILAKLGMF
jgi:hypothetical protein